MIQSRRMFVASLFLLLAACFHSRPPVDSQTPATLRVENQDVLDMTIYVLRGSERIRMGLVGGASTTVLPIPSGVVFGPTTLRFVANPIGSNRRPVSDQITVAPGDEVSWIIPLLR